jgi:dienelactone hydrolase
MSYTPSDERSDRARRPGARRPRPTARQVRRRRWVAGLLVALAFGAVAAAALAVIPSGDDRSTESAPRGRASPSAGPGPRALPLEVISVGSGARAARIFRPAGVDGTLPGVIFLHGWGLVAPDDYRPWIRHLARAGNAVIVPRYQRDQHSDPGRALSDALGGIRAALRRAPIADGSLVVAGHSAGAALAADYAASSGRLGLPVPVAVFAVYPGRRILGYPAGIPAVEPGDIEPGTYLTVMAGANDVVVGQAPAQELIVSAPQLGKDRRRFVLVQRAGVADHYGPTRATRAARSAFWLRLDRLITQARGD